MAHFFILEDVSHLLRLEDFKTINDSNLMDYLVKSADVSEAAQITSDYVNLGDLKGNIGYQNYIIPAGKDISKYNSAVIWCKLF